MVANLRASHKPGRYRVLTPRTLKQRGWRKYQFTKIYKALYLSVRLYGAPAWRPWLATTCLEMLERIENGTLRVISGQRQTTPVGTLK